MSSFIDENTQFVDDAGTPLAGGMAYFGVVNLDPKLNLTTIFSDRGLTTPIANPQTLNAEGRSSIKIWVDGEYSLLVEDVLGVQHLQELDQGQTTAGGNFPLTNVGGTANAITADGTPPITVLIDKAFYVLEAILANTGAMTLAVDAIPAVPIRQNVDQEIQSGKVQADQTLVLVYNDTPSPLFEWVNPSDKVIYLTKATDLPSNSTTDIWATAGNFVHITGTNTINAFGTAPQPGSFRNIVFDGALTINHGTGPGEIIVPGAVPLITAAGDTAKVIAETDTTIARITRYQRAVAVPFDGQVEVPWTFIATITFSNDPVPFTLISGVSNINSIDISIDSWTTQNNGRTPKFQLVTAGGIITTGYDSAAYTQGLNPVQGSFNRDTESTGFNVAEPSIFDNTDNLNFVAQFKFLGNEVWSFTCVGSENSGIYFSNGNITLPVPSQTLTGLVLDNVGGSGNITNGTATIRYR